MNNCIGDLYTVAVVEHFSQGQVQIEEGVNDEISVKSKKSKNTERRLKDQEIYSIALH